MSYIDWILPFNVKKILKLYLKKEDAITEETAPKEVINPILQSNKELNNSVGNNKTCYILACGPSINEMELSTLIGKDCISVSNFFVHPLYQQIQPKYHVFAPTHEPITEEQYNSWIKDFQDKTSFKTTMLLSAYNKTITDKVAVDSEINRLFYELTDVMPELFNEISLDKPLPRTQTVVHIAIYIAIALGYKEINLLGVDHDWLLHYGESKHFYNEEESKLTEKGYISQKPEDDLEDYFKIHLILWQIYKSIKTLSYNRNFKIFNLNKKSFLDVFPIKTKF